MHPTSLAEERTLEETLFPVHDIPMEMLNFWQDSINSGHVDAMCSCFHPTAVVWATFKRIRLQTPEQIRDYKQNLADTGTLLEHVFNVHLVRTGHDYYQVDGETVWRRFGESCPGRFSANLIHEVRQGWRFTFLHSSLNPPSGG